MSKKTVCVDIDGVLAEYDRWRGIDHYGKVVYGAVEFLQELRKKYNVVIFTCRCNSSLNNLCIDTLKSKVKNWLDKNNLVYDEIFIGQGKPPAHAYIDDRAIHIEMRSKFTEFSQKETFQQALRLCEILEKQGGK